MPELKDLNIEFESVDIDVRKFDLFNSIKTNIESFSSLTLFHILTPSEKNKD
jgi:hypothetical protein